jgi:hypothetical protein
MASLRSLLSDITPPTTGNAKNIFYVRNFNYAANNGGCCYLWTVPAGITSATFEMWGGGADGGGSRNCEMNGVGATTGVYAIKTIPVETGQAWRICAAGSTTDGDQTGACCSCGAAGNPSYVACNTNSTIVACAAGGCSGDQSMSRGNYFPYSCCWAKLRTGSVADMEFPGSGTAYIRNTYCHNNMYEVIAGGLSSGRATKDMCGVNNCFAQCALERYPSCPAWPGGVGGHGVTCGDSYRTGQHGAAGQIKVSYQ